MPGKEGAGRARGADRDRRDLRVVTPMRVWRLRARSAREAAVWAKDVEEVRLQAIDARKTGKPRGQMSVPAAEPVRLWPNQPAP